MRLLALDTIHGGEVIASALREQGFSVDCVDVYRSEVGISPEDAFQKVYSCCIAPVHLDPAYPLLHAGLPVITHHQAAGILIGSAKPHPMIEITGARGKTTTAYALAHLMGSVGILHTSSGTIQYPKKQKLARTSITPASLIAPARQAYALGGWFIGECSLGVSGMGDLGILTSADDYPIAGKKRSACATKCDALKVCRQVLLPDDIRLDHHPDQHAVGDIVSIERDRLIYDYGSISGSFDHPLLHLKGYCYPLMFATAAACLLGIDPAPLSSFEPLPGRMRTEIEDGCLIVDASNSGTTWETTLESAEYARRLQPDSPLHLVIGQDQHAVCENFAESDIRRAIEIIHPDILTLVLMNPNEESISGYPGATLASSLDEARRKAPREPGTILLLAVKTWR
ncbi:coenzyme F430 synthase [Methanocalculus taiwanensis]|uniref:Coenzyme F430 synthase n=2 Tax=Methanocalculus taiwanensis TaxID=106207 RepID=A0ABD4TMW5_9EURY|nr:coenzyme F430 synthase [Methanocalculus taiwanensis]